MGTMKHSRMGLYPGFPMCQICKSVKYAKWVVDCCDGTGCCRGAYNVPKLRED